MRVCLQPLPERALKVQQCIHFKSIIQIESPANSEDPTTFIVPVLQFFGLPDYNFEPLRTRFARSDISESVYAQFMRLHFSPGSQTGFLMQALPQQFYELSERHCDNQAEFSKICAFDTY